MDIVRTFGVTPISVKRAVKRYREKDVQGFYADIKRRGPTILTTAVLQQAQQLLDEGLESSDVATQLDIKWDTFNKAIRVGRLHPPVKKKRHH